VTINAHFPTSYNLYNADVGMITLVQMFEGSHSKNLRGQKCAMSDVILENFRFWPRTS